MTLREKVGQQIILTQQEGEHPEGVTTQKEESMVKIETKGREDAGKFYFLSVQSNEFHYVIFTHTCYVFCSYLYPLPSLVPPFTFY